MEVEKVNRQVFGKVELYDNIKELFRYRSEYCLFSKTKMSDLWTESDVAFMKVRMSRNNDIDKDNDKDGVVDNGEKEREEREQEEFEYMTRNPVDVRNKTIWGKDESLIFQQIRGSSSKNY